MQKDVGSNPISRSFGKPRSRRGPSRLEGGGTESAARTLWRGDAFLRMARARRSPALRVASRPLKWTPAVIAAAIGLMTLPSLAAAAATTVPPRFAEEAVLDGLKYPTAVSFGPR